MLLDMSESNQFYLVVSWVVPSRQGGMDFTGAHSIWKCMVMPSQVSVDDTCKCFFKCAMGNHGQGTSYHPNLLWANSFKYGNKSFGGVCAFFHM
jgi:hypothetical protein